MVALPAATAPPVGKVFGAGGAAKTKEEISDVAVNVKTPAAFLKTASLPTRFWRTEMTDATRQEGVFKECFKLSNSTATEIVNSKSLHSYCP